MQASVFAAALGAGNHCRCGILFCSRTKPGALTSAVVAAIWDSWKSGILPSGQSGIFSPTGKGSSN